MRRLLEELPSVHQVHDSGGDFLLVDLAGEDPGTASRLRQDLLASSRIEVKDISGKYPDRRPRLRLAVRDAEGQRPAAERPQVPGRGSRVVTTITVFRARRLMVTRSAEWLTRFEFLRPWLMRRFVANLQRLNDALRPTELDGHYWVWSGLPWAGPGRGCPGP